MPYKLATFNANGIRARLPILLDWLAQNSPQVLCLQETKVQDKDFPQDPILEAGYKAAFWGQKSYNGVAILSKEDPDEVLVGFDGGEEEDQARMISARFGKLWVVNTYVPQGRSPEDPAFEYKLDFFNQLHDWFNKRFSADQPLLWTGDLNVAPQALDVFDPERLEGQVGFHPQERQALEAVMSWGLIDLFRLHHPDEKQFTFWDYRLPASFKRNLGWRLDHLMATAPLARACVAAWVDAEPRGLAKPSDHTFVLADLDLDRL
jgi:exodeoxyribonuclease-3